MAAEHVRDSGTEAALSEVQARVRAACGEHHVREAIAAGMSASDAFAKCGIM